MFLPINLNTATREEIMLIPGMGNRMVREFLEYRKIQSIIIRASACGIDHTTATLRLISPLFSSQSKSANDRIT